MEDMQSKRLCLRKVEVCKRKIKEVIAKRNDLYLVG
jgi:hypothetical protein